MEVLVMFGGAYNKRRVLVTGHTGFKGSWLSLWLHSLGAEVYGFSLPPEPRFNCFSMLPKDCFVSSDYGDLRDAEAIQKAIVESKPQIIFHLAAQPIVGISYREPLETFTTNALGTAILLEAVRNTNSSAALVVVTSDKCYRNDNSGRPFIETDPLGGQDVYSMSKAATEMVVSAWHASFFSKMEGLGPIATGRAGNVIGGGDYAEDRIIPDAIRAFEEGRPIVLRRPEATRPWQHVLESVSGYLALGQRLLTQPERSILLNYNFGPDFEAERSVQELMNAWLSKWPGAFQLEIAGKAAYSEAQRLSLDYTKAKKELGWLPVWNFSETVGRTSDWYRLRHESKKDDLSMLAFSLDQIREYAKSAILSGAAWPF